MKIQINKLGPIARASMLDLDKRFMVFVGDNGSGKTYVANLIFGLLRGSSSLFKDSKASFQLTNTFDEQDEIVIGEEDIPQTICLNKERLKVWFKGLPDKFIEELEVSLVLDYKKNFFSTRFHIGLNNEGTWIYYTKEKDSNRIKRINKEGKELTKEERDKVNQYYWLEDVMSFLIAQEHVYPMIFFPADRGNLLSIFKYIIRTEREEKEEIYEINRNGRKLNEAELSYYQANYSISYRLLIHRLEQFDNESLVVKDYYQDLWLELEEIMGGSIKVSETLEGFGRRRYSFELQNGEGELDLFMASSSVNQLAILYLYLKYWVKEEDNAIIIDEPEINLHPDNQIKLVNLLMKFADRDNNRVIMTTHSPLLADAVNNHIRIGYLQAKGGEHQQAWLKEKEEHLKQHAFDLNENLTYKDFVVHHFEQGGIEEYPITDYGVAFESFNKAIQDVRAVEEELKDQIYNSIYER